MGYRKLLEHFELGIEGLDLVMQQGIAALFFDTRGATDHDHRGFFGVSLGCGVDDLQTAHAIGDANRSQAAHARIGIGGISSRLLITGVDHFYLAFVQLFVKSQYIIAGYAKCMPQPVLVKLLDQVFPNRNLDRFHNNSS